MCRLRALQGLPLIKIEDAHIGKDLKIKVNEGTQPLTAMAIFVGNFSFKLIRGNSPYEKLIRRFHVVFEKQDDHWRIITEDDSDITRH